MIYSVYLLYKRSLNLICENLRNQQCCSLEFKSSQFIYFVYEQNMLAYETPDKHKVYVSHNLLRYSSVPSKNSGLRSPAYYTYTQYPRYASVQGVSGYKQFGTAFQQGAQVKTKHTGHSVWVSTISIECIAKVHVLYCI